MPATENGQGQLHYEMTGAPGGEVLVLVHSLGANLRMWDKVLPHLERSCHLLRYDVRGHGASPVSPSPSSIARLGSDLLFLLNELALERVNLCGLSLGGLIAMWVGIHAPARVNRLILANTSARIGTAKGWEERIAAVRLSGMRPLASVALDRWFTPSYRDQHPEEMATICEMVAATNPAGYEECCAVLRDTGLRSEIAAITVPCLVIAGSHDPATTPSDALALHSSLKDSSYVELDSSHLSAWERSEEFAREALTFLGRNERRHG